MALPSLLDWGRPTSQQYSGHTDLPSASQEEMQIPRPLRPWRGLDSVLIAVQVHVSETRFHQGLGDAQRERGMENGGPSGCQGGRAVWGGGGGSLSSLLPAPAAAPWVPPSTQTPARGVPWFCCGGPEQGLAVLTSPCTSNARSPGLRWEQSSVECRRQVTPPPSGYTLGLSSGHRCISAAELPHPGHCTWSG